MLESVLDKPHPVTVVAAVIAAFIIGIISTLIFVLSPQSAPDSGRDYVEMPTGYIDMSNNLTQCKDYQGKEFQACCDTWANDNDIVLPQCVGSWQNGADTCAWSCDTGI